MTIPNAPEPASSTEDLMTQMARQIAQAFQTIATHINRHDYMQQFSRGGQAGVAPPGDFQAATSLQIEQNRQLQGCWCR